MWNEDRRDYDVETAEGLNIEPRWSDKTLSELLKVNLRRTHHRFRGSRICPSPARASSTSPGDWQSRFEAIWHVDFEYRQDANHRPIPVCMFAYEQHTGATIELWRDQLLRLRRAPFDTGQRSLMVAYAANAELSCFEVLGWPFPYNVLEICVEAIAAINGDDGVWSEDKRPSLLATLQLYGLSARAATEK